MVVVIDSDCDNVLVYDNKTRSPMKANNGAYYGFKKDTGVDVDEAVECTSAKTAAVTYYQYIES